jgi:hypothetical protein
MGMCHQKVLESKPLMGSFIPLGAFVFGEVIPYE